MPLLHALVLGIVQGLSEFLPISSSGHLELVPWLLGWDDFAGRPGLETSFDVALHLGTLVGAVTYFRTDLLRLARAGIVALAPGSRGATELETGVRPAPVEVPDRPGPADEARLAGLLVVSAVPAGIVGLLLADTLEGTGEQVWLIAVLLIAFGLVLLWADRLGGDRPADGFRLRDALVMGVAQAVALQPGVSRSGVTITAGRWLRFDRDAAARLSFLMSLPVIAGAGLVEGLDIVREPSLIDGFEAAFVTGMVASAVTGWIAVWGTLRLVRSRTFAPFVAYRVVAGLAVLGILLSGWR